MSVKPDRDQTEIFVSADEALESERQLTSWACDDDAFVANPFECSPEVAVCDDY